MKEQLINVRIQLMEPMLGTVAKDKDIYERFIESKKPETVKDNETETVDAVFEGDSVRGWTGFHRDPVTNELFIYNYMVKGFIKNAGNVLKDALNVKNLRSKINNYVFVIPRRIYFGQSEPDGVFDRPIRTITQQGPRVSLIRSDYIDAGKELNFAIQLVENKEITVKLLQELFEYGERAGLGQYRNGGYGQFSVLDFKVV